MVESEGIKGKENRRELESRRAGGMGSLEEQCRQRKRIGSG